MKPQESLPRRTNAPPREPARTEEARRIIEEYADDLREITKNFRRRLN